MLPPFPREERERLPCAPSEDPPRELLELLELELLAFERPLESRDEEVRPELVERLDPVFPLRVPPLLRGI